MPAVTHCPCGSRLMFRPGRGLECPACGRPIPPAEQSRPAFVAGLDLGQAHDFTALAALEQAYGPDLAEPERSVTHYAVRHLERLPLGTPYPEMVRRIGERIRTPELRDCTLAVDQTGVGRPVVDMLRAARLPCVLRPITITSGLATKEDPETLSLHVPKRELVSVLQVLLQSGRLKIARQLTEAAILQRELVNFRVKITAAAHETFGVWREGEHDDLVLAVALAAWVGEHALLGRHPIGMAKRQAAPVGMSAIPDDVFQGRD